MKRIFDGLRAWLGEKFGGEPRRIHAELWGLTDEGVLRLRALRASEGYEVYLELLDACVNIHAEILLNNRDATVLHETRGVILGLRTAASLVDETLQAHATLRARRERDARAGADERAAEQSALFGSPSWGR